MVNEHLLAYLEGFLSDERKQRFIEILSQRTKYLTVAIEDVYQMHNTSAVIRSCEVFGIQEAHVVEERYGKRLDKNISMGAQQWVDVHEYTNVDECIKNLKTKGYKIVATTPHNDSCFLDDFKIEDKTALFFGTERDGLSDTVMENADSFLKVPMVGFTESLNISVSAAIILQNLTNQLKKGDFSWQLSDEEKLEKRLDWSKKSIKSIEGILERYHNHM